MAKESILIVEDEEDILEGILYNLNKEGYQVKGVSSGESALDMIQSQAPNLVILDLMLPGIDGLEVCKTLKYNTNTRKIPIIMLTAKGEESDIVMGLELGANDYIVKPFSLKVLIARIRAVLRINSNEKENPDSTIQIHELSIHPGRHEVLIQGKTIELTYTEFGILHFLVCHPGWVYTRNQIMDKVRGEDCIISERTVDVQIAGLRKKLGTAGKYVETVRGIGYRFME